MNTRKAVALFGALMLLAFASPDAGADRGRGKTKMHVGHQPRTFALSVEYTGRVGEDMFIEGVRYRMAKDVSVHLLGEGRKVQGISVTRRSVFLAGEMQGNDAIVRMIIVRPPSSNPEGADLSTQVRLQPAGASQ